MMVEKFFFFFVKRINIVKLRQHTQEEERGGRSCFLLCVSFKYTSLWQFEPLAAVKKMTVLRKLRGLFFLDLRLWFNHVAIAKGLRLQRAVHQMRH
jgi:hypothetical protein